MKNGFDIPVNAVAARVLSVGERHEYAATAIIYDSPFPMPTWIPDQPSFKNLTGLKVGRLTVIGYSSEFKRRWVCRCACGMYCLRKSKGLTSTENPVLPCHQCYRLAVRKKSDFFKRTGKLSEISEFL
jgi:hypothetical protein